MPHSFIKNVKRTQKNDTFFYKERKRTKRTQRSLIKNVKERNVLFKDAKECENTPSFEKNGCPLPNPA